MLQPPGGGSSFCLGDGSSETQTRVSTGGKARVPPPGSSETQTRISAGGKARVPPPKSYSCSSIGIGWNDGCASSGQRQRGNDALNKAPGSDAGAAGVRTTRLHEMAVETADRLGKTKQRDLDRCSNAVDDRSANDANRFYRDADAHKIGRQQKPVVLRPEATKRACELHRYHLAADGQADRLTGKANRTSSEASGYPCEAAGKPRSRTSVSASEVQSARKPCRSSNGASRRDDDGCSQSRYSQSQRSQPNKATGSSRSQTTATTQSRCSQSCYSGSACSEADSIPFGADWSTFRN